jgi:adenosylcobinamide kinase/adenosylcobinamide-phosphate guanylyltransferase
LKSILLTGGARSGKSQMAQELAAKAGGDVLFVATAEALDDEMEQRIKLHRKSRPKDWKTLEVTRHVGTQITRNIGGAKTVIIDCITLLVSNILQEFTENVDAIAAERAVIDEIDELLNCIGRSHADFIVVTNEVGLGIVPGDMVSRLYRDLLGRANQLLAENVNEVYLLVAGIPIQIK